MTSDMISMPVTLLGLAMLLALLIERLLEIVRSAATYFEAKSGSADKWTKKAEKIRDIIELRLDKAKADNSSDFNLIMNLLTWYINKNASGNGGAFVISADKTRKLTLKVRYKLIAITLGIISAALLNIDLFQLVKWSQLLAADPSQDISYKTTWYGITLAGIAIGMGAQPMHKIITALEKARKGRIEPE